jgi:trimethylamine--corrinoid protein Co-methyltransferase
VQGLEIDEEALAADAFLESGPGDNFLSTAHTLRHFETANYRSALLSDTQSFEQWSDNGSIDAERRANTAWKEALASFVAPEIDPATDRELLAFMKQRKEQMPDRWH